MTAISHDTEVERLKTELAYRRARFDSRCALHHALRVADQREIDELVEVLHRLSSLARGERLRLERKAA